jgi:hypothetical protein
MGTSARSGMPSITLTPAAGRYLSIADRDCGVREIARPLGQTGRHTDRYLDRLHADQRLDMDVTLSAVMSP